MLNLNNSELYSDLKARSVFKSSDNDQRVKLLLNFDNSFEDESQYYHSFINVNNVSLNTNIKKFGNSSAYFNGSSYLYYKDSDEFFFGIDDFTIEFWFYPTNNSSDGQGIIGQRLDWNNDNSWYIYYQPLSNCFMFQYSLNSSSQTSISFGTIVSLNTWHHVAVCRSGSALNCFVDGTPYSYTISAYPLYNSSQPVRVGASMPTYYFTGYLDNLIIYKGLSKYSIQNNLSLPTEESIVTANTRLLIHGESYNKNTAGHTVTRYGDANINTSIYKFGDGSGYFDGSGDYLTIPYSSDFDFGTGDFTLEFNLKWPAASYQFLFGSSGISGAYHIALNYDNNANTICVGRHAVAWDTAFAINMPLNTWCHLVLQKKSGYLECYLDGYIIGRTANNISYNALGGPIHLMAHNSLTTYSGYVDEIRISKGIARYQYSNFTPSINAYETDQYTKLLLHAEESDNSTNFVDSSGVYKLILPINNTCLSTSQYKFSPSSLYLNGTNNYLTIPSYDCFNFGTEDFTIDCWVYITNTGSYFPLIEARPSASYSNFICGLYYISGAFKLDFVVSSGRLTSTSSIQLNQWQHIAFIRTSGILKCFINGTLDATTYSYSSNISYGRSSLYIGYNVDGNYLNGYIDELRVSKGIARWIENFTPPTEPYATDQYTKLLLHMTGTDATTAFIDSSDSPKTVTRYGDARLDAYNKIFGLSSGYFDGAGDYLTVPYSSDFDFGTGDFTIECWGYASSIPSVSRFCASGSQTDGGYRQWFFGWGTVWGTGTKINFGYYTGSGNVDYSSSAINISLNTWNHFAVTRYNNYINFFINGIPCGSVSISSGININSSTTVGLMIGARMNTNSSTIIELVTGYIDELRISKSIARWTSNFTPPTEQYTSDQYTKLLLHFDGENNAPFLTDSSNAPITLSPTGDAKIKTDNYKFGSSAMYFDGSVDCLTVPFSYDFILTTVDFTIDAWVRLNAMPTSDAFPTDWNSHMVVFFLGTINTGDGYGLVIGQTKLILNSNNTQIVSGTHNMVINTWYHVAVVRRNNFFYLFVNGSVVGQASSTVLMGTGSGVYVGNNKTQGAVFNGYIDELRVSKGIARWTANFTPPLSAHTTDQYTKLLMHFPSTDKNQSGKTITRYGDAKISTDQYKFGLSSGYFDGTGDYLTAQASTDFNFSSDNLTIDFWWYSTSSSRQWFFSTTSDYWIGIDYWNNKIGLWASSNGTSWNLINSDPSGNGIGSISVTLNQWNHVCAVRNGDNWLTFLNGSKCLDITVAGSIVNKSSNVVRIGTHGNLAYYVNGYIDEIRISKGIARYTENFTPPTTQHTTDQYTKLLLHFDAPNNTGTFIDSSNSTDLFTDYSSSLDQFVDQYNPSRQFINTNQSQVSTGVYKFNQASLYFDGTSYISTPNSGDFNFGTGDFTIHFWLYSTELWSNQSAQAGIIGQKLSDSTYGWVISRDGNNPTKLNFRGALTNNFPTLSTPAQNTWEHWAITRSSGQLYWFKNGILDSVQNTNTNNLIDLSGDLWIGKSQTWGQFYKGYIDEIVILKESLLSSSIPNTPSLSNLSNILQAYSERNIVSNKQFSAKLVASDQNAINKYFYYKFNQNLDLSKYKYLYLRIYPTVSGQNIKFSLNNLYSFNNCISGGTATADSYADSNYLPSYGCDRNFGNRWSTNNSAFPHWWKYDFGSGITKKVIKIGISNFYDGNGLELKNFTFYGSNDDSNYDLLYTGLVSPTYVDKTIEYFKFNNETYYRYYKIIISSNYRSDNYVGFWEVEFYEQDYDYQIEYTPNITNTYAWQNLYINLSNYTWIQKNNIDKLLVTITNFTNTNTFYIDDIYACNDADLPLLSHQYTFTVFKDLLNKLTGSSSLKFISSQATSISKKIKRKLTTQIDLSTKSNIVFAIYSNRTGSNFKIRFINSRPTELITKTSTRTIHAFYANTNFNPGASGQVNITVLGAGGAGGGQGGWKYGSPGGPGGKAVGILTVSDQTYQICAGAEGICYGTNTLNGRSNQSSGDNRYGGQSGGYAGIFVSSVSQANALIIAGGGGGGGSSRAGSLNYGGAGGGLLGSDGSSPYDGKFHYVGRGASQTTAGSDAWSDGAGYAGEQAALQGGRPRTGSYGGGGGGGYFGGSAGGYSESNTMGGGGGGSGYINTSYVTNYTLSTGDGAIGGNECENGQPGCVIIDYLSSDFPERQATNLIEITPNVTSINNWQLFELDISNVSTNYKNAIDQIEIEVLNDNAETIFYLDYIFSTATYYIDPTNGNNTNTGLSWAAAWKTITSGPTSARMRAGDLVKIAKSPDPVSIGSAQWNNLSKTITLSNTPDGSLTTTSLISKNVESEGWYPIQSINSLIVLINNHYANSGTNGRGYFGVTELIETYRRETYKLAANTDCTIQLSGEYYLDNRGMIKFEGGYNTSSNTQDGETFFDAVSGGGNGIDLSSRQYISLNKLNMVRANYGLTLTSALNNIINSHTIGANTMHSIYMNGTYYNIINIKNLINNGNDALRAITNNSIGNKITCYNINNNLACGLAFNYSYQNEIYSVNCCNNIGSNIGFFTDCQKNKLKILNNKNSTSNYGLEFLTRCLDNDIFNTDFSGNLLGTIKTTNGNQNYLFNASMNDAIKIGSYIEYCNFKIFSNAENNDITQNRIYTDRGTIASETLVRHTQSGVSWKLSPTNIICSQYYPLELTIARVLCLKDIPVTVSCWMFRVSSDITARLILKKYQTPDFEADIYRDIESVGSWEQAQLIFQTSIDCVLEISVQAFGGTIYNIYVDDFNCSQI